MNKLVLFLISFFALGSLFLSAQDETVYQEPPEEIIELVDAPSTPSVNLSPGNDLILLMESPELPSIDMLAIEELRLGGIRIDPMTNGPSRFRYSIGLRLMDIDGGNERIVQGLPKSPRIRNVRWSPDGKWIAFTHTTAMDIELWIVDVAEARARKLEGPAVNDVMGNALNWLSDSKTIIYTAVPEDRGEAPTRPRVADGPVIQENIGRRAAVRTYQDLISDRYDEAIFDHYATSQLYKVDVTGNGQKIGEPGVIWYFSDSPDGNYLLVNRIRKPYSYIVPFTRFPQHFEVIDTEGNLVQLMADIPLSEDIPQGFGAVREGPRNFTWRADAPAILYWVEALDGGDPAAEADHRDQVFFMGAPFDGQPTPLLKTELRYSGITWGRDDLALVREYWRRTRRSITSAFHPTDSQQQMQVIFDRSVEDRYNDPGNFQTTTNEYGKSVLHFDRRNRKLFLFGQGASPEGNRPFVDEYILRSGETNRLWRSEAPYYELPVQLVDANRGLVVTRRESQEKHPNFYMRNLRRDRLSQITDFPDPFPQLRNVYNEMVHYEREDGIPLNGTLYLPEGYDPEVDEPLSTILWAYPREFISTDGAGQVTGSPYTYTRVGATSPVMLVTQGYAVLNNASFPIVGDEDEEPNDTFVEQLVANAEAAINKLVEMGVTDPERVGVSGHSYGAFMTANLLSHSNLFAAGVARSGAFNRTLTPFGFQAEERTYWDAPEIYHSMSPFMHADKMKTPMLLIHGADDNNSGTFPMQSERYYDALRGHGATVRLVMLPHESHGYRARESALHMHWEWLEWFDRYVKNKEQVKE